MTEHLTRDIIPSSSSSTSSSSTASSVVSPAIAQYSPSAIPDASFYFGAHCISACEQRAGYQAYWLVDVACPCLRPLPGGARRARVTEAIVRGEKLWFLNWYCAAAPLPSAAGEARFRLESFHFSKSFRDEADLLSSAEIEPVWGAPRNPGCADARAVLCDVAFCRGPAGMSLASGARCPAAFPTADGSFSPCLSMRLRSRHVCQGTVDRTPPPPACPAGHRLLYRAAPPEQPCSRCAGVIGASEDASYCGRSCYICEYYMCKSCFDSNALVVIS